MSLNVNQCKTQNELLLATLMKFYENRDFLKRMVSIINGESRISLRIVDWFVTNFAKKYFTVYDIPNHLGEMVRFKVYHEYKLKLKAYAKVRFDPFCRWERISIPYDDANYMETTLGQLNFFKWAIENQIINETKSACIKCKKEFTTKYSLARHINENRCRIIKEKIRELAKYNINIKNECKQQKKQKKLEQLINLEQLDNLKKQIEIETKNIETKQIENLQIQIKLQEQELQVLRQIKHAQTNTLPIENKDKFETNFIYLIIEKEYITNNEDIFKIGKTTQKRLKRFDKYKSGSILLSYNRCTNCHTSEKEIIELFKTKYKQRLDIGLEYFEGNHEDMIDDIYSTIKFNKEPIIKN
jgi:hypothetical protein